MGQVVCRTYFGAVTSLGGRTVLFQKPHFEGGEEKDASLTAIENGGRKPLKRKRGFLRERKRPWFLEKVLGGGNPN